MYVAMGSSLLVLHKDFLMAEFKFMQVKTTFDDKLSGANKRRSWTVAPLGLLFQQNETFSSRGWSSIYGNYFEMIVVKMIVVRRIRVCYTFIIFIGYQMMAYRDCHSHQLETNEDNQCSCTVLENCYTGSCIGLGWKMHHHTSWTALQHWKN